MNNHSSHITNGEQSSNLWASEEYNGNNGFIFNANNGTLNNNNKVNSYRGRISLDFDLGSSEFQRLLDFYASYLDSYHAARRHKRSKNSQLDFEYHLQARLIPLVASIFYREYVPLPGDHSVLTKPVIRELIASKFDDRVPATRFVKALMPHLERDFFYPNSYSCRVGKGSLRAVEHLIDNIRKVTNLYTRPAWLHKEDFKNFFGSIAVDIYLPTLMNFIETHVTDPEERDELTYLARIIYQSSPTKDSIYHGDPGLLAKVPKHKSLFNNAPGVGVPLGNWPSQMYCLIVSTLVLSIINSYARTDEIPELYTDDIFGCTADPESWLKFLRYLERKLKEEYCLDLHPNKRWLQYYKKTINVLGYKVKYGTLLLPGDRLVHNFKWYVERSVRKANIYPNYIFYTKEHFAGALCSYLGLLKHTASYNLRRRQMDIVSNSPWGDILDIDTDDYLKVSIKPEHTRQAYLIRQNIKRKQLLKSYYNELKHSTN